MYYTDNSKGALHGKEGVYIYIYMDMIKTRDHEHRVSRGDGSKSAIHF